MSTRAPSGGTEPFAAGGGAPSDGGGREESRFATRARVDRAHLREWLHGAPAGAALLGTLVGIGAGGGAVVFRYLVLWMTEIFTGTRDYSAAGRVANPHAAWLGPAFLLVAPVLGGLLYGPLIARFAPEARGHGVPEVMFAVARRGGRIDPAVAVVKALASALCIGSGGSVGREGPIVQIGSALGSTVGQLLRVPPTRMRLLVACGAAGGISATFNAPIAGVMFALELILCSFEAELFAVVVLASVAAAIVGRAAFGAQPFLSLPAFHVVSSAEYPLYLGLGLLAAVVGVAFIKVLYSVEDLCDRLWRWPAALRPAAGGLLLGLLLLALPQMYGVGYPVLERATEGHYIVGFLLVLIVGKLLATSLTIGIGGSGGIFAPSLFLGAMLGSAYGEAVSDLLPHQTGPTGAYAVVGMAAVFAAAARAPITAVLIVFELTGDYRVMLPLMLATVVAVVLAGRLSHDTIYSLKLRRRGIDIGARPQPSLLQALHVRDAMRAPPAPLAAGLRLEEVLERFDGCDETALPVVDSAGVARGIVHRRDADEALRSGGPSTASAADLALPPSAILRADQTLEAALELLVSAGGTLPVQAAEGGLMIGWLNDRDALGAYRRALLAKRTVAPGPVAVEPRA
jgi:CIC family chloride channel protein